MKKLYILGWLLVTSLSFSQTVVNLETQAEYSLSDKAGAYFKDVNGVLNKFLGTWRYQNTPNNPTKVFEITFYKTSMKSVGGMYTTDVLTSRFKYIENGVTVYNTTLSGRDNYITGSSIFSADLSKISLMYYEPNINNLPTKEIPHGDLALTYQLNSQSLPTLNWRITYFEGESTSVPFRIPVKMVLNKVN